MKKAFTLIELLVVIAIIAILAAILFPVFAQARNAAKKTADLSNSKQIGLGLQLYINDTDDTYPPSNHRINSGTIEVHWSWMVLPYMKNEQVFVSPADKIGGWAPGCFDASTNNRGYGVPAGQINGCVQQSYTAGTFTQQVGRISYIANQILIGRKRQFNDGANVVITTLVDDPSGTILIAPATESKNCMQTDVGGEFRSYRPAMPVTGRNQVPIGGATLPFGPLVPLEALRTSTILAVFDCDKAASPTDTPSEQTIRYTHRGRFDKGNNYVMADTSARWRNTMSTFDTKNWKWGKRAYSLSSLEIMDPATGLPVQ